MKTCKWCGFDIDSPKQICIDPRSISGDCESDTLFIGYRFYGLIMADERHKFYRALKDAHFVAYEIHESVLAMTEDIVEVDAIFKRTVNHDAGLVHAHAQRFSEHELEGLEKKYADESRRKDNRAADGSS